MSLMMALMCVFTLSFSSCGSDDDDDKLPAPEITINEANIEGDVLKMTVTDAQGLSTTVQKSITEEEEEEEE